jgi:aminoglycoside 6-adenylyltransferase
MRTEKEMLDIILGVATNDERVRAVAMNGSRTNPNAPKDPFQDFDIVYIVTDVDSFVRDPQWIDVFGERIIMQTPDIMPLFPSEWNDGGFAYLMLFADGNRIDLSLSPIKNKDNWNNGDKLSVILLDKDHCLPALSAPTDEDYWVKRPSPEFFADCCNEFWWISTYVAKGLWRKEILYAQDHLNKVMRPMLLKMLEWQVGIQTDYSVSTGKSGKYLEKYLSEQSWKELLSTYAGGSYDAVWEAMFAMCKLFRSTSKYVADHLQYEYPHEDDSRVSAYLEHVHTLSPDAAEIY